MFIVTESDAVKIGKAVAEQLYRLSPEVGELLGKHSWQFRTQLYGPKYMVLEFIWNGRELTLRFVGTSGEILDQIPFSVREEKVVNIETLRRPEITWKPEDSMGFHSDGYLCFSRTCTRPHVDRFDATQR